MGARSVRCRAEGLAWLVGPCSVPAAVLAYARAQAVVDEREDLACQRDACLVSITAAVCDPLWGSIPMMNTMSSSLTSERRGGHS